MRGLTLIEIIIAIAILGIILAIATVGFHNFFNAQKLDQLNEDLISFFRKAREKTITSESGLAYGVHIQENKLVIFRAPNYTEGGATNETLNLPSDFFVSQINLENGKINIIFQPLTGETSAFGTIIIEKRNDSSFNKTIRVYETGVIEIQ